MKKNLLVILACLLFLTGCSSQASDGQNIDKIKSELDFFSSKITDLLNSLNNISLENYELVSEKVQINQESEGGKSQTSSNQASSSSGSSSDGGGEQSGQSSGEQSSQGGNNITVTEMRNNSILNADTETVNWDFMKQEIENVNSSWSVVMLDLYNANVSSDDVMAFEAELNNTIIGIKNQDKPGTLANLCNLYSYIPKFLTAISAEQSKQNIENTKYYVLTSYAAASLDDWNTAITSLSNAESSFLSVLNDTEYSQNKEYKVNKTYMLIKDLQTSVANNDKLLFFLKYKNLMESINTL